MACHSVDNSLKVKVGPPLWGIVNRNAASISDFKYSDALINFKKPSGQRGTFLLFWKNQKIILRVQK